MSEIEHLLTVGNVIGEGPLWDSREASLYWVNFIEQFQILRFRPKTRKFTMYETGIPVMALGLCQSGGFVAATSEGFAKWEPERGHFDRICQPLAGRLKIRFNDAAVDCQGRFFAGTLDEADPKAPHGELFCLDQHALCRAVEQNLTVCNGMGWSPDRQTMYLTDSFRYCIYAYDFEPEAGTLQNRRIFAQRSPEDGIPDGLTVDSEGFVWSAMWGGYKVIRYAPDGGVDRSYFLPVPNPSSCAFGGKHLDELYITSASLGLSQHERELYPMSGDLFRLRAGIRGQEEMRFAG